MGKRKLRVQPKVSDQRAKSFGIDVGVARGCCDALMAQEGLHVAQVGSALVEKERGGPYGAGVRGNNWHPRALAGELEACVEGLVAKGRAVPARKDERRAREVDSPPRRSRTPLTLSRKANHSSSEYDNSWVRGRSRNAFDLEAGGDNHPTRLAHQPIHRQQRPLMVSAAGKKEGSRQMIDDMRVSKAALVGPPLN